MEAKIRKISAAIMGMLVLLVAVAALRFSGVEVQEQTGSGPEARGEPETERFSGMELLDSYESQDEEEILEHQMQMELPEGISQEQIMVENDIWQRTVFITIPGIDEGYYFEHPLRGSSTHIDDLMLGSESVNGFIEITLDEIYEVETKVEDSWLYLDFIPLKERYEKVIVVDAGHGGNQPGAVVQGICEKDLNLEIVLELKNILDQHPEWKVLYTRTDDSSVSLSERVQLANLSHADMFISVHNNSTRAGEMSEHSGTEVLYDEEKAGESLGTEGLATILLEETTAACGSKNLGLTKGHSIYIIRNSEVPVALIEVGFMTSFTELNQLNSKEYRQKVAQGIYQGIVRAIEEGY